MFCALNQNHPHNSRQGKVGFGEGENVESCFDSTFSLTEHGTFENVLSERLLKECSLKESLYSPVRPRFVLVQR